MKLENSQTLGFLAERIKVAYEKRALDLRPICLVGHQGIGKTAVVKSIAEELGVECRIVDFHALEPGDLVGLMKIEGEQTVNKVPSWFPKEGKGILFIDEINRIQREILACFYNLIIQRKMCGHELGKDWVIVAACNPSDADGEEYDVMEMDSALVGRFRTFGVASDVTGWLEYIKDKYKRDSMVYQYCLSDPSVVSFDGKRGTPRDFENLQKTLMAEDMDRLDQATLQGIVSAEIGPYLAQSFMTFLKVHAICSPYDVLNNDWRIVEGKLNRVKAQNQFDIETILARNVGELYMTTGEGNVQNISMFVDFIGNEKSTAMLQFMKNLTVESAEVKIERRQRLDKVLDALKKGNREFVAFVKEMRAV